MRDQVFISYRHETLEHARDVRRLADMLRAANIPVVLDQFYLEEHPGGPDEGWPKWCEDCANQSACVLIIASEGWFAAYEKTEPPRQGLGAATEADLFRQEIYDEKGHNERIRLTFLHSLSVDKVPPRLRPWHQFRPFENSGPGDLMRWIASRLNIKKLQLSAVQWPRPTTFETRIADRNKDEWPAIVRLLAGQSAERILLFEGRSGLGKSALMRQAASYATKLGIPVAYVDFKGGAWTLEDTLGRVDADLGAVLPNLYRSELKKSYELHKDLRATREPVLLIFDTYEDIATNRSIAEWLNVQFLADLGSAPAVAVLIAGQAVPNSSRASWCDLARQFTLAPIIDLEPWKEWVDRRYPDFHQKGDLGTILKGAKGQPSLIVTLCEAIAKN